MPAAAAIAVVGATAISGKIASDKQAKAAKDAANAQVSASNAANATQLQIYNDQKELLTPAALAGAEARAHQMLMTGSTPAEVRAFLERTYAAYGQTPGPTSSRPTNGISWKNADDPTEIMAGTANNPNATPQPQGEDPYAWVDDWNAQSWLESTPGYQFRLGEGQRAVDRSASARGRLFSGATMRAQERYGQDYATGEWGNLYDQFGTIAGDGTDATGTIVNVAGNYGENVSQNQLAAGDARASGYVRAGDANASFWNNTVPGAIGGIYGIGSKSGWFS